MYKIIFGSFTTIRKFLNFLGNLQFAILLLLTLALMSALGSIIEQDKAITFYELNYPLSKPLFGFITSDLILFLGLNHVYSASWFLFVIFLFCMSLLSCTFARQIPSLRLAKLWKFFKSESSSRNFTVNVFLKNKSLSKLSYFLRQSNYNVIHQGMFLYAYKGLIGKVGPILVHISIIFVLFGSIYGVLTGFMAQEIIPKNQLFHLQNIITSGPLSYIDSNFQGYIKDFKITYSDEGLVDQFYSDLTIIDSNLMTKVRKTIFVNEPLKYDNLTVYQTDWNIAGIECVLNEDITLNLPVKEIQTTSNTRFWITSLPINKNILLVLQDLTGNYLLYNSDKKILGKGEVGQLVPINGKTLRVSKIVPSTGLQIKSDPGIAIVYGGFFFLIISVVLSYISYSQIWAIKKNTDIYVYGITNRGVYFFEKQMNDLITKVYK